MRLYIWKMKPTWRARSAARWPARCSDPSRRSDRPRGAGIRDHRKRPARRPEPHGEGRSDGPAPRRGRLERQEDRQGDRRGRAVRGHPGRDRGDVRDRPGLAGAVGGSGAGRRTGRPAFSGALALSARAKAVQSSRSSGVSARERPERSSMPASRQRPT